MMPDTAETPMMRQYWSIKEQHPDALLFYRMGDFYEMFFDDAKHASETLNIVLTTRGKHQGKHIPMCGVPVHSSDAYLLELIRAGHRVAVCEQTENPEEARKRGTKEVVRRAVVRVVTPGTLTEESLLEARRNNFLGAWSEVHGEGAFAWLDMSTGEFRVGSCPRTELGSFIARIAPSEVLLPDRIADDRSIVTCVRDESAAATPLGAASFDSASATGRLKKLFRVASLEPFGEFTRAELSAMGAITDYVHLTQRGAAVFVRPPRREMPGEWMQIDAATRRNLELTETLSGERTGSLLGVLDRTATSAGSRLLTRRLASPSTAVETIAERHDVLDWLSADPQLGRELSTLLRQMPDTERAVARLVLGRGGPRELGALRDGLRIAVELREKLGLAAHPHPSQLEQAQAALSGHDELRRELDAALAESLPHTVAAGDFIAPGYVAELDESRRMRDDGKNLIRSLQETYRKRTGIQSLRIRSNNVLGFFIETRAKHADILIGPKHAEEFKHRQSIVTAARFSTAELEELERRIIGASSEVLEHETLLFEVLRERVLDSKDELATMAQALAEIDVAVSLAHLAADENWVRPELTEDLTFTVRAGRHPVVETALRAGEGQPFVANDCDLSNTEETATPLWIVTGPNMAGKSTFLRQNALITILAQMGSFVPAQHAQIGIVDRMFSRVGAADDLARGRSTFMVEMVETATILHQAGPRSMVILDEIGRGTATYDGMSIAWAVVEHLRTVNQSRALFATHFHELTELAERLPGVHNATISVTEWEGDLVFFHEVVAGMADRSYGVQVARLAGLPDNVIARANEVLARLESDAHGTGVVKRTKELPLFDPTKSAVTQPADPTAEAVLAKLESIDPDSLTPKAALEVIYQLRQLASLSDTEPI